MNRTNNILNSQKGISLYLSILMMAIVLALALGINSVLVGQLKTAREVKNSVKAFYAAESGIEYVSYKLSLPGPGFSVGTVLSDSFEGGSYQAVIAGCGVFQSRGKFGGTQRAIEKRISSSKIVFAAQAANGNLGGMDGANNICQSRANLAKIAGNYKAWISGTDAVDAPINTFNQASDLYFNLDCAVIADGWSNLIDGFLDNPINKAIDQTGAIIPVPAELFVFTNTNTGGSQTASGETCNNWTAVSGSAKSGKTLEIDNDWTQSGIDRSCNSPNYIYCFEQ